MTVVKLAFLNLRQRLLSAVLTGLLVALGVGLTTAIWVLQRQAERSFVESIGKFHLLVGPKGSGLQLTLNACFHLDRAVGTIPYATYQRLASDPAVEAAWPFVAGDTFDGFAIVGTQAHFLTDFEPRLGQTFSARPGGRFFTDHFEAVLGADVAAATGLSVGDRFVARHGLGGHAHDEQPFTVVGLLDRTDTPHDRAIWCSMVSVDALHDDHHSPRGQLAATPTADRAPTLVTAAFVRLKNPQRIGQFAQAINRGRDAMAVYPTFEIRDLFDLLGYANQLLEGVALMVLFSAGVSIFLALYNGMAQRHRDIAIIRALGAPPTVVLATILTESATICGLGSFVGWAGAYAGVILAGPLLREEFGVVTRLDRPQLAEPLLIVASVLLGMVAALVPALQGYRTDVIANLRPIS